MNQISIPDFKQPIKGFKYIQNFISSKEEMNLIKIINSLPWSNEIKRRVQHYGYKYSYKDRIINKSLYIGEIPNFAKELINKLRTSKISNKEFDQVIINEYKPGQGISAHIDCVPCFDDEIISLSLGSNCEMEFVNIGTGEVYKKLLERCSLLSLKENARYDWTHSIKPRFTDNYIPRSRRISITFRKVILK